jgi:hypothetical protein
MNADGFEFLTLPATALPFYFFGAGQEPDEEDGTLIIRAEWDDAGMRLFGPQPGRLHATVPGPRDTVRFWSIPGQPPDALPGGDFPCCAQPEPAGPVLDARAFFGAVMKARRLADSGTMVLFEPEGSEPGTRSFAITSVTYEEDLAGALVIRGRPEGGRP